MYYHGSLDISDTKNLDACISLVVSAMQGESTDMDAFTKDMSELGLEKKITKKSDEPADVKVSDKTENRKKNNKRKKEPVLV